MQKNSISKIIIGTAQFGLEYGVNNKTGKLSTSEVEEILNCAIKKDILTLDTADAYGDAIDKIGNFHIKNEFKFKIITKFKEIFEEQSISNWLDLTLRKLEISKLECCMFHKPSDFINNPQVLKKLVEFHKQGLIDKIGVSIYSNEHFKKAIANPNIHIIQLPYNLLDNDFYRGELIKEAKGRGKIIHVRSVFLQGLFFMDLNMIPEKLERLRNEIKILQDIAKDNDISMETLALQYVISNKNIDGVLLGVDSLSQLKSNVDSIGKIIPFELITQIDSLRTNYIELLNPVNWL